MTEYEENIIIEEMNRIYRNLKSNNINIKNIKWLLSNNIWNIIQKQNDFTVKNNTREITLPDFKYYYKGIEISKRTPLAENIILLIKYDN